MLLDSSLIFSDKQAITAAANSTNVIDLGPMGSNTPGTGSKDNAFRDIGAGQPMHLSILVTATFTASSASGLAMSLVSSDAANLGSPTKHWISAKIPKATLVKGYWIANGIMIPAGSYKRYLGLRFGVTTANFTAGAVSAYLHHGRFDETTMRVVGAPGSTNVRI